MKWASPLLAGQAEYLRHLGTAPASEVYERDRLFAVRTGVASNSENAVLSADRLDSSLVSNAIGWLAQWAVPASWICAEGNGRCETARVLEAAGCRPDDESWEMSVPLDRLDLSGAPGAVGATVAPVSSERELDEWLHVAGACGWFENAAERRALRELHDGLSLDPSSRTRLYVARRRGSAVGMASAFYGEEIVLLTAVCVLEDQRRAGVGRLLALTRLREAVERGCTLGVLAPSPDGAELYRTLGFEMHNQPPRRWFYLPVPLPPPAPG